MSNAPEKLRFSAGDFENKFTEITDETEIEYTRTGTILKITIVRWNSKGYWEMLSDGSKFFTGYCESIEEEYLESHPDHDSEVPEAWQIVPSGQWQPIIDLTIDEATEELKEAGYQVFIIPVRAEVAREFMVEVATRHMGSLFPVVGFEFTALELLKEWEEADAKNNPQGE